MSYVSDNNRARTAQLKFKVQKLERLLLVMAILMVICFAASLYCITTYTVRSFKLADTQKQLDFMTTSYDELSTEYDTLYTTYEGMYDQYMEMIDYTSECEDSVSSMYDLLLEMQEQNETLIETRDEYKEQLKEFEEREELYDKYEYAIIRGDGTRTDITYDQLKTVEDLSEKEGVDTDLILSIAMVESNGTETATNTESSARGYGQFLNGTGKYVYEKIMEAGNYSHDKAYDGTTSLTMMVEYVNYLSESCNNDLYAVIQSYRGMGGSVLNSYIHKIDNYLAKKGKSVSLLDQMMSS